MSERRSFVVDVEADLRQVVDALKDAGIPIHRVVDPGYDPIVDMAVRLNRARATGK